MRKVQNEIVNYQLPISNNHYKKLIINNLQIN